MRRGSHRVQPRNRALRLWLYLFYERPGALLAAGIVVLLLTGAYTAVALTAR